MKKAIIILFLLPIGCKKSALTTDCTSCKDVITTTAKDINAPNAVLYSQIKNSASYPCSSGAGVNAYAQSMDSSHYYITTSTKKDCH